MMLVACSLIIAIVAFVVWNGVNDFKYRFEKCFFFASFGLIFGIAPLMQSRSAYVHEFGESARVGAALYALAGLIMLLIGYRLAEWPAARMTARAEALRRQLFAPANQRLLKYVFWLSIFITVGGQLLMMYAKDITLRDILEAGRFEHRFNNRGFQTVLALHLTSFIYVPAFVGLFLNRRYQIMTLLYVFFAGAIFFLVFSKGTRSIPLAQLMTLLVSASIRYTFTLRHVIYVSVTAMIALALAIGMFELRKHQNSLSLSDGLRMLFTAEAYEDMWDCDPLNYSTNLVGAVEAFPTDHPYLAGATYRRMLVFFLRESRFPDLKPPDTNILFGLVVHDRPEDLEVTVPPSILGDVYINFWGWKGLPVLCLHGMLYCWLFRTMRTSLFGCLWIGPLSGRFLTLIHRGEPYEMFFLFVMFLILMGLVYQMFRVVSATAKRPGFGFRPQSQLTR